jgi:hypothetical protein
LAGVVVVIVLLARQEEWSLPAVLALVGFGLLLAVDLGHFARGPMIGFLTRRTTAGVHLAMTSVDRCDWLGVEHWASFAERLNGGG